MHEWSHKYMLHDTNMYYCWFLIHTIMYWKSARLKNAAHIFLYLPFCVTYFKLQNSTDLALYLYYINKFPRACKLTSCVTTKGFQPSKNIRVRAWVFSSFSYNFMHNFLYMNICRFRFFNRRSLSHKSFTTPSKSEFSKKK